ncbi:MAG: hypothetical protein RL071_4830 [Pseudomonadota bacterium]
MSAQQLSLPQRSAPQQAQNGPQNVAPAQAPAKGAPGAAAPKSKGVMGWLRGAGQWVSEKAGAASAAVGDFVDKSKQVAKDAYEVAKATDIGWKDGKITVETDLDELMDLVPAHLRAALQLDRKGADNTCKVSLDPRSGVLVLTSAAVAIGAVDAPGLKTGPAFLRDVRIEIARPGGGLQGVDPAEAAKQGQGAAVKIHVGSADVSAVKFNGKAGPVTLDRLQLEGLSGELGRQGGPLSLEGGDGRGSFALKAAVLAGLRAQGHEVAEVKVAGASGALGQGGEQAHLAAEQLEVKGAKSGGQSMGSARVKGLRVDAQNQGGGLPMADAKADHLRAKVAVEAAEIRDFDGADADVKQADLVGATASYDQDAGSAGVAAKQLGVSGLDTAWIDAQDAALDGVDLQHRGAAGGNAAAIALKADALRATALKADAPTQKDAAAPSGAPLDWSASLGKADVTGAQAGAVQLGGLRARGLDARGRADGAASRYAAKADQLGASGVHHKDISVEDIAAVDVAVGGDAKGAEASAAALSAQTMTGKVFSASSLRGKGAKGRFGAAGASGSIDSASVRDAKVLDRVEVAAADVSGLRGGPEAGGGRSLQVDEASVSGVRDTVSGARLGRARLRAGALTAHEGGLAASLGDLQAEELSGAGAKAKTAALSDVKVQKDNDELRATLGSASLTGAAYTDQAAAATLSAKGLRGGLRRGGADLAVDRIDGAGLQGGGATARAASAEGIRASLSGDTATGAVSRAQASGLTTAQGSVGGVQLAGVSGSAGPGGGAAQIAQANVQDVNLAGVQAKTASASGLSGAQGPDGLSGRVATAEAQGLSAGGVQAASVQLRGAQGRSGKAGDALALEALDATQVKGSAAGISGGADTAALRGLDARRGGGSTAVTLDSAAVTGLTGKAASGEGSAAALRAEGLRLNQAGGRTTAGLAAAHGEGLRGAAGGTRGKIDEIDIKDATLAEDAKKRDLGLGGLSLRGAAVQSAGGGAGGGPVAGLDLRQLAATGARRVDSADVNVQAPLRPGAVAGAPVKVREGTALDASVQVRDNRLVPGGTKADLSRPLDGPLWTGVRGAYMTDDNELKADLSGTLGIDMDLGGKVNDSLGIKGDALPSLGALGEAYARTPAAPASSGGPSAADVLDLSRHRASGSVGLSAGGISAGQAGGVELARGQRPGDNTVKFESDGQTGQKAAMQRILLNSARAQQGGVSATAGKTSASGVRVEAGGGKTKAELDALQLQGLQVQQRKG